MKKKLIIIQSVIIFALTTMVTLLILNPYNISEFLIRNVSDSSQLIMEYGDAFSGFELTDYNGEIVNELAKGKMTIVTYISDSCSSCKDILSDFNRFSEVFGNTINYSIIWTDRIPYGLVDKYKIDSEINYSLSNSVRLSTSTPTFYILDDNNQVVFCDVERTNLIKKLVELDIFDRDELKNNATLYIAREYFGISSIEDFNDKLVYFYMPGCPDCAKVDTLFKDNPLQELDIKYIYKYDSVGDDLIIDKDKLFVTIYEITWYPSFLVARNGNIRIVGEMPTEKIINEILK